MDYLDFQKFAYASPVTVITTAFVLFLGILFYLLRDRGYLPGPRGLPYFGYWPYLTQNGTHLELQDLMKKYGDVFSFTLVGQEFIHLGTIKAVKEAHITKSDCFAKRYSGFNLLNFTFNEGVLCINGESWKVQRKFFLQAFRDFGMTAMKDYMAGPIYDTVMKTVEMLKAEGGKPVNLISILNTQCAAILRRTMFNDEGITNEELMKIVEIYGDLFSAFIGKSILLSGEFARRFIFPRDPKFKLCVETQKTVGDTLKKIIRRHEATFDKNNIRNVIDRYIQERNERRRKGDPSSEYFNETSLVSNLVQFVGDGTTSVAFFVCYFIQALLDYPEEQEKIFKELEDVVGTDRQPTLDDKSKLTYTNAFIHEVNRTSDVFPLFPSVECTNETTINGHKVRKGAITVINFWSCHRDPKTFKDPYDFKPSRFISEPGKQKSELPITFGIGKRSCTGEAFVMMQVFLFSTTIVKNFRLTLPEGYKKKSVVDGCMEICAHPRK